MCQEVAEKKNNMGKNTFDAIVIGSGISGGWAAKELTDKGLKTLILERGRDVKHIKDYPTTNLYPWEFKHRGEMPMDLHLRAELAPFPPVAADVRRIVGLWRSLRNAGRAGRCDPADQR